MSGSTAAGCLICPSAVAAQYRTRGSSSPSNLSKAGPAAANRMSPSVLAALMRISASESASKANSDSAAAGDFLATCPSPQIPCKRESKCSFCCVATIKTPMAFSPRSARTNCARCRTRMSGCFKSDANSPFSRWRKLSRNSFCTSLTAFSFGSGTSGMTSMR